MSAAATSRRPNGAVAAPRRREPYEGNVIGAGISGMYQLHRRRELEVYGASVVHQEGSEEAGGHHAPTQLKR